MKLSLLPVKIKNAFTYLTHLLLFTLLKSVERRFNPRSILLVRLDSIGDYILVRNFIRHIKLSPKYKDYRLALCGNILWKELAETLDSDVIDEFLWLDRSEYKNSIRYKYNFLKNIRRGGFETAVDITFSREILFSDTIIRASNAAIRVGSSGSPDSYVKWKRNLFSDRYYTKLIPADKDNTFEFYRNKEFFKEAFEIEGPETIEINIGNIEIAGIPKNKFAVIFPGANEEKRRWYFRYFADVAAYIQEKYSFEVVIAGAKQDKFRAEQISNLVENQAYDFTGKTTLSELAKLISKAELLISNETSAVHFAAGVKTPFVCISNGNHFGRFHPYPPEIFNKGIFIYPPAIMNRLDQTDLLKEEFRFNSDLNINEIKPESVKQQINNLLNAK